MGVADELLTWHSVTDALPDADLTVLLWVAEPDGSQDWVSGWLDGETWRDSTAMPVAGRVTHWAEVGGPRPLGAPIAPEHREELERLSDMAVREHQRMLDDAARYRWLRTAKIRPIYRPGHPRIEHYIDGQTIAWSSGEQSYADAIDAAIDKARSKP